MKRFAGLICITIVLTQIFGCRKGETANRLQSFQLSEVHLHDGPFLQARKADIAYLLALDPDRLLSPFLKDAGLKPLKENYGNWENTGLDGHMGGHYLSALAFMYASTGETELLNRIEYMITWLKRCQEKNGNGYVGGIPSGREFWIEIAEGNIDAGAFSLNHRWVPLYNIHKLFAGLYDVYINTGNVDALEILIKLTDWFYETTRNLNNEQIQTLLISEHGGLNEVFVNVAELTGTAKYLEMARKFSHRAVLEPLIQQKNELTGLHANTQIPKVIGFERYAQATKNKLWDSAAVFFWNTVINDWTISIGGNSVREHFHPANDFSSMVESEQGPETCNTYNMLKLTKLLYLAHGEQKYLDYYERALFNHILSSEHPVKGGFVYFTPMRPRHYRVYSQPQTSFWCCVGSGIENPGKYGEMIYAKNEHELFVNLFIASEVNWKEKQVTLVQDTKFPYQPVVQFTVNTHKPQSFTLNIRMAQWMYADQLEIKVNGEPEKEVEISDGFIHLNRKWNTGDKVSMNFSMKTYTEFLPDSSHWVSFLHGPIVLGAITDTTHLNGLWADTSRMGHVANGPAYPMDKAPILIVENGEDVSKLIQPVDSLPLHFTLVNLKNVAGGTQLLQPFFTIHEARYTVYWPVYTQNSYLEKQSELARKEKELVELNRRTIDLVWPGEQQPEEDHFIAFESSETGVFKNRHWRHALGYFSYRFKNPGTENCLLRITYYGGDTNRKFSILVNKIPVAQVELTGNYGDTFVDVDYPVSSEIIGKSGGKPVEIKFVPATNSIAGGIYGIRLMR
ncbi:MAG TPA: glycosyl hydrolase [Marinilabiliales bacterium]|nr:MAG: glycosyl hydrolase [Bacteroidetes bacterium GWA2_40_14]OFX73044.1 MAG: glycosyl hydrolase [Bacteroidetes bacterium GWD2_40_43]OFX91522.1 MAG: glycosyl hydrolase [Bacteroidetes bacterium GWE2_40_63]OFY19684.1 MAG: glycosyl hydrolase [Bacteroidetes bacterium GWF2_40_13]OFZ25474.1 MAG: glycosyl hydrolase [Bacteroidetes bacterium RIFOXYC2_FULL_40_12]HAN00392.1 glycosyl hydrolase [Marinilabiliales bacterium]